MGNSPSIIDSRAGPKLSLKWTPDSKDIFVAIELYIPNIQVQVLLTKWKIWKKNLQKTLEKGLISNWVSHKKKPKTKQEILTLSFKVFGHTLHNPSEIPSTFDFSDQINLLRQSFMFNTRRNV